MRMSGSWSEQVEGLVRTIKRRARGKTHPFVVAIDGRSGVGKSTLAKTLAQHMAAEIISSDDFFAGGEGVSNSLPRELAAICIDWKAQRAVLEQLHRGQPATFLAYNWVAFDGSKSTPPQHIEARKTIILEGVYSARPELRDLIDLRVLLTAPDAVRGQALVDREGGISAWEAQWHRAEDWYFSNAAPSEIFDFVIARHA